MEARYSSGLIRDTTAAGVTTKINSTLDYFSSLVSGITGFKTSMQVTFINTTAGVDKKFNSTTYIETSTIANMKTALAAFITGVINTVTPSGYSLTTINLYLYLTLVY